jgi:hypothetical protein
MSPPPTVPYSANPANPDLTDVLELWRKDLMLAFNSHHVGTVRSFDAATQTCTATINYKQTYFQFNEQTAVYTPVLTDYPTLVSCPLIMISGAGGALTMGDPTGQECLVLFNDRDIDNWYAGNSSGAVATSRLHSFSDGIILVGLRSLANALPNYDSLRPALRSAAGETVVAVNPTAEKVLITNTYPANSVTLNTLLAQLITQIQALVSATSAITVTSTAFFPATSSTPTNSGTISAINGQLTATAAAIADLLE